MTREELKKLYPQASESCIAANVGNGNASRPVDNFISVPNEPAALTVKEVETVFPDVRVHTVPNVDFTPRPSTDEQKLNKTEKAYLRYCEMLKRPQIRIQAITLKLAHDCRFTPDVSYLDENGRMVLVDVKGGHTWEDALIKIRVAARMFSEFRFILAKKNKSTWDEKEIKP